MVDAGGSDAFWPNGLKWALRTAEMLAAYDVAWFEEPLQPDALDDFVMLRRQAPLPIAGGEVLTRRQAFAPWLQAGAFDIVQPDVTKVGGICEERRIGWMAQEHGVRFIPHGWNTAIGLAADLHLASAFPDTDLVEYIDGSPYVDEIVAEPWRLDADGMLAIPDSPGLGSGSIRTPSRATVTRRCPELSPLCAHGCQRPLTPLTSRHSGGHLVIFNSPERIAALTPLYRDERFADGRPRVPDEILERMRHVTNDEAWGVVERGHDYHFQFEGDWVNLHPDRVLVGRAVTVRMVPLRPDLQGVVAGCRRRRGSQRRAEHLGDRYPAPGRRPGRRSLRQDRGRHLHRRQPGDRHRGPRRDRAGRRRRHSRSGAGLSAPRFQCLLPGRASLRHPGRHRWSR